MLLYYSIIKDRCTIKNVKNRLQIQNLQAVLYFLLFGGGERVRTDGLLRARQALSQLSYTPI